MKRFYFWIVTVIVALGILPAYAQDQVNVQFTVNVPNPEAVKCTVNNEPYELVKGANVFDVAQYTSFYFEGISPWKLTGVTNKTGTAVSGFYGDAWYMTVYDTMQDEEFTLSLVNLDEYRTAQFTINIDDPSLVTAVLGGYYTTLNLEAGKNVVKYDPAIETYLTISPSNYSLPLYSVKLNGTEVASSNNSFYVELTEDCVVDIVAILPDEDHVVNFSYSEGAEGSISLLLNYTPVTDWDGKSLTVKLGDQLTINGNTNEYKFNDVKVGDQSVNFQSSSYSFSVMKDTEVYIDAHPYGTVKATLIIPNPELITIYKGYSDVLPMQAGENVVELPENNALISWTLSEVAIMNSVTLNGEALPSYYTSQLLENGDVLAFDITEKVFDKTAVVWIDNVKGKACNIYLDFSSTTDHSARMTYENGYNIMAFYEQMNPFNLVWYGSSDEIPNVALIGKAYLNGELLEPMYEGSTTYSFDLADNDVLKLFMDTDPVECKVAFEIAEGVDAKVVKDIVTVVEDAAAGFDCFAGTQVVVSGDNLEVKVNGTAVAGAKDEEGNESFTFVVEDAETAVAVAAAGGSAVEAIEAEADSAVFNMQGVCVGTKASLKSLAPGIYIVAGKKVIVTE